MHESFAYALHIINIYRRIPQRFTRYGIQELGCPVNIVQDESGRDICLCGRNTRRVSSE